jgi:hypothetical protein
MVMKRTVMVNNSININKTNIHLSTQLIEHKKNPRQMTLEIEVVHRDRHQNDMGSQPSPLAPCFMLYMRLIKTNVSYPQKLLII